MQLSLHSFSTALYATWHFVEELRILFDAGDGVSAGLLGKAGKLRHVFISHADRDHLTGLLQLLQLNPIGRRLTVHHPADCGSFPPLAEFCRRFDPHVEPPTWAPIRHGDEIDLTGGRTVRAVRNPHVAVDGPATKSLSYFVVEKKRRVRDAFRELPSEAIRDLIRTEGADHVTEASERRLLGYSADTPVLPAAFWAGCDILVHEATFQNHADSGRRAPGDTHPHSVLPDVLAMAREARPGALVLTHFSSRYTPEEIEAAVARHAEELALPFPVHRVFPGERGRFRFDV